ncbi:MAG TPA: hypothetical protein VKP10_11885 [Gemmatimonadales bacterium]|nr:hypothetical protein [Gemmatimonadales bacterium]
MQRALTKHLALLPLALLVAVGCMHDRSGAPTAAAPATSPSLFASKVSQVPGGPPPIILRTDKSDYSPGETVVITGQGWKPGSNLSMVLEVDPRTHDPISLSAVVDAKGNFTNRDYVVQTADLGVLFKLTVTGYGEGGVAFFTDQGQAGTTLTASKTATAHYTRTFPWTITKSVDPATLDLFRGDAGTSEYTVSVTKGAGVDAAWLDGQICVTNGGAVATENLAIVDRLSKPSGDELASVNVNVSANPVLDPGETGCYDYRVDIPSSDVTVGATYKNTADITITNHSGHLGTPFGPNPSATAVLPAVTLINNNINVDDTNGGSWAFSASGSATYNKTFTCDADEGAHNNTATIRETGQSDGASVTVNCYALSVTKDASTTYDRTYTWKIDKSADQSSLTLALNQSFVVNYSIVVSETFADANIAASGNITVHNPAPIAAPLTKVADAVSGVGAATVDCGVTFPYNLAAGGDLKCTYSITLPDITSRTNTATATLQNTPSGTTDFTGTADVKFGTPSSETDECIVVSDTYAGDLGTVCAVDAPKTFTYSRTIGPYATPGTYTVDNTASFVTNDQGTTDDDSWTVNVNVPGVGCSLTIGYWKTHAGFGPQADMVTALLPIQLGTVGGAKSIQVTTASLAVQLLSFNGSNNVFDGSNGINKLYAQLLGAKLDIANGSDGSAVASTITAADAFLATHNSTDWSGLTKPQKNLVLSWVATLDQYNNGLIGPGHCSQ